MNQKPIIEPVPIGEGFYIAKIDGVEIPDIKAKYPNVVRRKAAQYLNEQAQKNGYAELKEAGL